MTFKPGALPLKTVYCRCGAELHRYNYLKNPRCRNCLKKDALPRSNASVQKARHQARRYRILLHLMGYSDEQFEEMREEIKKSILAFRTKAETWGAKVDERNEQKRQRRLQDERRSTRSA